MTVRRRIVSAALGIACLAATSAGARPSEPLPMLLEREDLVTELHEVRTLIFGLELESAERRLDLLERQGGTVAARHHLAMISLIKGMITDDPAHFVEFFERSDALAEALGDAPAGIWRSYFSAENALNRALAHAKSGRNIRAALAGRSAFSAYRSLMAADPSFEESYKGYGVLQLAVATLPKAYRSVLRVLGYGGTVDEGLELLRRAVEQSTFSREEAGLYLALLIAQVERTSDEPVHVLARLYEDRSESPLIAFFYGYMLLHHRQASLAEEALRPVVAENGPWRLLYARYYLGRALFLQDRFEEAFEHLAAYLENHQGESLRAEATLLVGLSLEARGRRDEAVKWYGSVDAARGHDSDHAAAREARERLERPLIGTTRELFFARNAFDSGRYDEAVAILTPILRRPDLEPGERAEAAYRMGRAHHALGRPDEALAWYAQGALNGDYVGGRWAPWGHFYRAEILAERGDTERARREYRQAASFSHTFDFRDALHQSVRAALQRLPS